MTFDELFARQQEIIIRILKCSALDEYTRSELKYLLDITKSIIETKQRSLSYVHSYGNS